MNITSKTLMTMAAAMAITLTGWAKTLPGVAPMAPEQLAQWRAEETLVNTPKATAKSDLAFYTGKPYAADLNAYVFPFRNYNPDLCRWTVADPSGFPDGANNYCYAPTPNMGCDPLGLQTAAVAATATWSNEDLGFSLSLPGTFEIDVASNGTVKVTGKNNYALAKQTTTKAYGFLFWSGTRTHTASLAFSYAGVRDVADIAGRGIDQGRRYIDYRVYDLQWHGTLSVECTATSSVSLKTDISPVTLSMGGVNLSSVKNEFSMTDTTYKLTPYDISFKLDNPVTVRVWGETVE